MSEFSREKLVVAGVRYILEGNSILFDSKNLKKRFKNAMVSDADLISREGVDYVKCEDIRVSVEDIIETTETLVEIEVKEAEFVPCGEGCGCGMTQEEAEKALCKAEKPKKKTTKKK